MSKDPYGKRESKEITVSPEYVSPLPKHLKTLQQNSFGTEHFPIFSLTILLKIRLRPAEEGIYKKNFICPF